MFNFNFNSLDITTALAGIAGIGNIITTINNLKQDKYQVENFIYSLKNYRDDIEKYFTEAKKDIELLLKQHKNYVRKSLKSQSPVPRLLKDFLQPC